MPELHSPAVMYRLSSGIFIFDLGSFANYNVNGNVGMEMKMKWNEMKKNGYKSVTISEIFKIKYNAKSLTLKMKVSVRM